MEKPFTLKVDEFTEKLVNVINESEMPAFVVLNVLQTVCIQIKQSDELLVSKYKNEENNKKGNK